MSPPMGERSQTQSSCSLKAAWLPESENGSDSLSETSPGLQTHSDSLWKASSECQVKTGLEFLHFCMLAFVCFHTKSRRGASGSQGSLSTMCSFKDSFKWKFVNTFQTCLQKAGLVRKACWKLLKTSGSTRLFLLLVSQVAGSARHVAFECHQWYKQGFGAPSFRGVCNTLQRTAHHGSVRVITRDKKDFNGER